MKSYDIIHCSTLIDEARPLYVQARRTTGSPERLAAATG